MNIPTDIVLVVTIRQEMERNSIIYIGEIMTFQSPLPQRILKIINSSDHPLGTREIADRLGMKWEVTITRLRDLRGDGKISGRCIPAAKGVWIWWRKDGFEKAR